MKEKRRRKRFIERFESIISLSIPAHETGSSCIHDMKLHHFTFLYTFFHIDFHSSFEQSISSWTIINLEHEKNRAGAESICCSSCKPTNTPNISQQVINICKVFSATIISIGFVGLLINYVLCNWLGSGRMDRVGKHNRPWNLDVVFGWQIK